MDSILCIKFLIPLPRWEGAGEGDLRRYHPHLTSPIKGEEVQKLITRCNSRVILKIVFIFVLLFFSSPLWAASEGKSVQEGNKNFKNGQFDEAMKNYEEALQKSPESDVGNFNAGAALYKQGRYQESVERTQKALLSENKEIQQKAQYNLGNAFYKWGISEEDKNISSAIKKVEQSLSHYEKALSMRKDDEDAQSNDEFVKKELERLKKKQQEEQQKKSQEKQNNQNQQQQQQQTPSENKDKSSSDQKQKNEEQKFSEEGAKEGEEDYNKNTGLGSQNAQDKKLTAQEAQMLLKNYEATEEPKGLFRIFRSSGDLKDVEKDW